MPICDLCHHHCHLEEGATGFCRVRTVRDGRNLCGNYGFVTSLALDPVESLLDDRYLPVGYRKDNAEIYSLDFRHVYCCLIAGLKRSGKTSMLRLLIREALRKDCAGIALIDLSGKLKNAQKVSVGYRKDQFAFDIKEKKD